MRIKPSAARRWAFVLLPGSDMTNMALGPAGEREGAAARLA